MVVSLFLQYFGNTGLCRALGSEGILVCVFFGHKGNSVVQFSWVYLDRKSFAFLHGYPFSFLRLSFSYLAVLTQPMCLENLQARQSFLGSYSEMH